MRASVGSFCEFPASYQCKKNLLEGSTVTILTSLLGTKAFGLMLFMWQEAAAPAATPAVDHFSLMTMIKSMGAVAIARCGHSVDHVGLFDRDHGRTLLDVHRREETVARVCAARGSGFEERSH